MLEIDTKLQKETTDMTSANQVNNSVPKNSNEELAAIPSQTTPETLPVRKKIIMYGLVIGVAVLLLITAGLYYLLNQGRTEKQSRSATQSPTPTPTEITRKSNKQEIIVANSSAYVFNYDEKTKKTTITLNGNILHEFSLSERPLAAWVYKPDNTVAIVTSTEGTLDAPHSLYVVKNSLPIRVIAGEKLNILNITDTISSNTHLYDYWDYYDAEQYKRGINYALRFSPDGKFILVTLLQYEGEGHVTIKLQDLSVVSDDGLAQGSLYWSPDGSCVFNFASYYGDSQEVVLARVVNGNLVTKNPEGGSFVASNSLNVLWNNNCSGIVHLEVMNQTAFQTEKRYYRFDYETNELEALSSQPDLTNLRESAKVEQENIFFTALSR